MARMRKDALDSVGKEIGNSSERHQKFVTEQDGREAKIQEGGEDGDKEIREINRPED